MDDRPFGDLQRVEPAAAWRGRRDDFVPWLARPENLRRLGDALSRPLRPLARDKPVGRYRADLLCRDAATGCRLLIEARLGPSEDDQLGRILTCAAGLEAGAAVWLAAPLRQRHRAACEWLNAGTGLSFLGVEFGLFRIGDSPAAPQFRLVAGPAGRPSRADAPRDRPQPVRRAVRWLGPRRRIAVRG